LGSPSLGLGAASSLLRRGFGDVRVRSVQRCRALLAVPPGRTRRASHRTSGAAWEPTDAGMLPVSTRPYTDRWVPLR